MMSSCSVKTQNLGGSGRRGGRGGCDDMTCCVNKALSFDPYKIQPRVTPSAVQIQVEGQVQGSSNSIQRKSRSSSCFLSKEGTCGDPVKFQGDACCSRSSKQMTPAVGGLDYHGAQVLKCTPALAQNDIGISGACDATFLMSHRSARGAHANANKTYDVLPGIHQGMLSILTIDKIDRIQILQRANFRTKLFVTIPNQVKRDIFMTFFFGVLSFSCHV